MLPSKVAGLLEYSGYGPKKYCKNLCPDISGGREFLPR
jgi:hypothetical protein